MKNYYSKATFRLTYEISGNNIMIHDTRPVSYKNNFELNKLESEIFLFTDETKSIGEVNGNFCSAYKSEDIEKAVQSLIDKKISIRHKDRLLSLAIAASVPDYPGVNDIAWGYVLYDHEL